MSINRIEARLQHQAALSSQILTAMEDLYRVEENTISQHRVEVRFSALNKDWQDFSKNHQTLNIKISRLDSPDRNRLNSSSYFSSNLFKVTRDGFLEASEKMTALLDKLKQPTIPSSLTSQPVPSSNIQTNRLPRVDLPKFNGDYNEWLPFKDMFCSLVNSNNSLSQVEKLYYLKTCLTGSATQFLKHTSLTGNNFSKAWSDLSSYYDNKRVLIDSSFQSLFGIKSMNKESASELERLFTSVQQSIRSLETLSQPVQYWDSILVYMTTRRLDPESLKAWQLELGSSTDYPSWTQLNQFLIGRLRSLQSIEKTVSLKTTTSSQNSSTSRSNNSTQNRQVKAHVVQTASSSNSSAKHCQICNQTHYILNCAEYSNKSHQQKIELIKKKGLCFNCLGQHRASSCQTTKRCLKCGKKPHTSIHPFGPGSQKEPSNSSHVQPDKQSGTITKNVNHLTSYPFQSRNTVLLATALVCLDLGATCSRPLRALIDPGSEVSLVNEHLVQEHLIPRSKSYFSIVGAGAHSSKRSKGSVVLKLKPHFDSDISCVVTAEILPKLTNNLPSTKADRISWTHFEGLKLADPNFTNPASIDILLGSDVYNQIILEGLRKGPNPLTDPIAQATIFGWIISGPSSDKTTNTLVQSYHCSTHQDIYTLMENFWHQEDIPQYKPSLSPSEQECENLFTSSVSRTPTGRYSVKLPFKSAPSDLGESKSSALHMLNRTFGRFSSNPKFKQNYEDFLKEYESLGHMELVVSDTPEPNNCFYLPHHGIYRPNSESTKLRVMFNGSSKSSSGTSLNDHLHTGAKLQIDLINVLIWFRRFKYVFSTDIEKMYRQIVIHPNDRDFQRIFWKDPLNHLVTYRLTTVTYGLACAPFLALRTLNQLVTDEGLLWQPINDSFHFEVNITNNDPITKGKILSQISKVFDPLGFLAPVTIKAKILLQALWTQKLEWDDPIPQTIALKWLEYSSQLDDLSILSIPRWIGMNEMSSIQIHGFSDASQAGLAAAIYLRSTNGNSITVSLICAKTKVSLLKRQTIPRLELSAAVLLSRLTSQVCKILEISNAPLYLWTDSSIVHTWIINHPSKWKDYVHNRVCFIHETLPQAHWRLIPDSDNPADCASRGLTPAELTKHSLWWNGPHWLVKDSSQWPNNTPNLSSANNLLEERPSKSANVALKANDCLWDLSSRYSNLTRLLRITVYCQRICKKFKREFELPISIPITPEELSEAKNYWIKKTQEEAFAEELRVLSTGQQLPRQHSLNRLTPFVDNVGLIRVGGRFQNSALHYHNKHPLILPQDSALSNLIIKDAHSRTLHGSTQDTLIYIRSTCWILGGRRPIRSFIFKCVTCSRYRQTAAKQLMGQLPFTRVTQSERPFINSGIDYAGPFNLKTWSGRAARCYKAYIVLFICQATSAVHIELATDYTSEAFLAAYRRFTARRGICKTLSSDCGTNLKGSDAELQRLFAGAKKELRDFSQLIANDGTKWIFNPPAAPHFGGKWEAGVKSVKYHLRRVLGNSTSTYEEMMTLLTQIEAVLNSRPLCPLTEDPDDLSVLTPGHFIIGHPLNLIPEPSLEEIKTNRLSKWQRLRHMLENFWTKWSRECLQRHLSVYKWNQVSPEVKIGTLVLIIDERYPPSKWPLGRVTQVHPGRDGHVRVATIKTQTSSIVRPIVKLCPLPIPIETN